VTTVMSVPETTVDKDDAPPSRKDEVGRTGHAFCVQPKTESKLVDHRADKLLRGGVPSTDPSHDAASLFWRNAIHNPIS